MASLCKIIGAVILTATLSSQALALGLGDIQINSKLGFPLDAYLPLTGADTLNPGELKVQLASREAYEAADIYRSYFLTRLQFEIVDRGQYGKLVHIKSERPLLDPHLELIVHADSDDGSILRHYSLIVDFPK